MASDLAALDLRSLCHIIDTEGLPVSKAVGGARRRTKRDIVEDIITARAANSPPNASARRASAAREGGGGSALPLSQNGANAALPSASAPHGPHSCGPEAPYHRSLTMCGPQGLASAAEGPGGRTFLLDWLADQGLTETDVVCVEAECSDRDTTPSEYLSCDDGEAWEGGGAGDVSTPSPTPAPDPASTPAPAPAPAPALTEAATATQLPGGQLAAPTAPLQDCSLAELRSIIDAERLGVPKHVGGSHRRTKSDIIADMERARGAQGPGPGAPLPAAPLAVSRPRPKAKGPPPEAAVPLWQLPGSAGAELRLGDVVVQRVLTRAPGGAAETTFFSTWLGGRELVLQAPIPTGAKAAVALPAARMEHEQRKYELVGCKVRVFAPHLGIFKGVLCKKQDIDRIQLPPSMRKVGPSRTALEADDWALLLVTRVHPTTTNAMIGRRLHSYAPDPPIDGFRLQKPPPKSFSPKPLTGPIPKLWRYLGVPPAAVAAYRATHPHSPHAWLCGVADPTDALPPGHCFVPGWATSAAPDGGLAANAPRALFVTRSPCVKPADGRLLPVVRERPAHMPPAAWEWLRGLPFGAIVFATAGDGPPLPETVAAGDLDGDYYFVCWGAALLAHVRPHDPSPAPPAADPVASGAASSTSTGTATPSSAAASTSFLSPASGTSSNAASASAGSAPAGAASDAASSWLSRAQAHMTDVAVLRERLLIGKLYTAMEKAAEAAEAAGAACGMDDPDAQALAEAYLRVIDGMKHGGDLGLPNHLRQRVGLPPL